MLLRNIARYKVGWLGEKSSSSHTRQGHFILRQISRKQLLTYRESCAMISYVQLLPDRKG